MDQTRRGRIALSTAIAAFLAVLAVNNVPVQSVREDVTADDAIVRALGTGQVWSVFAPNPQQVVSDLRVEFAYRDGTRSVWRIERGDPWIGSYRDYRWLKLAENASRDERVGFGLLAYAARERAEPKPLARADLVRRVYDIAPAGRSRDVHDPPDEGVVASLGPG